MAKKENKTVETNQSVSSFVKTITDEKKRKDFAAIVDLVSKNTSIEPKMWGPSIVGFGSYHYKYESGREGNAPLAGLSPRSSSIVLYLGCDFEKGDELLAKLGKYKMSGGCVHIKKLEDIDTGVMVKLFKSSMAWRKKNHA